MWFNKRNEIHVKNEYQIKKIDIKWIMIQKIMVKTIIIFSDKA